MHSYKSQLQRSIPAIAGHSRIAINPLLWIMAIWRYGDAEAVNHGGSSALAPALATRTVQEPCKSGSWPLAQGRTCMRPLGGSHGSTRGAEVSSGEPTEG
jgi:hypothetical protein